MRRPIIFGAGAFALALAVAGWRLNESSRSEEALFEAGSKPPQAAPLCPWREPERDLARFFSDATRYETETRILSGQRGELAARLGRAPTGDENALRVYRVFRKQATLGSVLIRRVKGTYGAIELVLAVSAEGEVRGLRLQRLREPESIAAALQNPQWLNAFAGRRADSSFQIGRDIPDVAFESRASAAAIADGVRSLLIQLDVCGSMNPRPAPPALHH